MKKPRVPPKTSELLEKEEHRVLFREYLARDDIQAFIAQMNAKHLHWNELLYRTPPENSKPEIIWAVMKLLRQSEMNTIQLDQDPQFLFKYRMPPDFLRKLHLFDLNLGGSLQSNVTIPAADKERYLLSSIMEEAIASSQLEGAATTREKAKQMLRSSRKPQDLSEQMIFNNYLTISKIVEMQKKKLTPEIILEFHALMTSKTLEQGEFEGKYRKSNNIAVVDISTGETLHLPPDFRQLPSLMKELCRFINEPSEDPFIHPVVKASIIHFLVGYIHPFVDGNGRTARALFYWFLLSQGYWLVEYMSISRIILNSPSKYALAYLRTETDDNDMTYFIDYQLSTLETALLELRRYITRKVREKEESFFLVEGELLNPRQRLLITKFAGNPTLILTIEEARNIFGVSYASVRNDLQDLEKAGWLRAIGKRNIRFIRSDGFAEMLKELD